MALMTIQNIAAAGAAISYGAVALSDTIPNGSDERNFLHVKNGSGASINVTFAPVQASARIPGVGTIPIPTVVVAVPATSERMIGPFSQAYTDASGNVTVAYSAITTVTAAAIRLPGVSI